jgi:hypothetical protein
MIVVGVMGSGKELEREEKRLAREVGAAIAKLDIIFSQAAVVGRWRL